MCLCLIGFSHNLVFAQDLEVGAIADDDVNTIVKRQTALNLSGYSLGPAFSLHDSKESLYQLAYTNHREASFNGEVRIRMGLTFGDGSEFYALGGTIGGAYFFSRSSASPFVGGAFGLGTAYSEKGKSVSGFVGSAMTGVRFFRTSTTQLELSLRFDVLLKEDADDDMPSTVGIGLGVLF